MKGNFAVTYGIGLKHAVGVPCSRTIIGHWKTKIKAKLGERKEEIKEAKERKKIRKRVFLMYI